MLKNNALEGLNIYIYSNQKNDENEQKSRQLWPNRRHSTKLN